MAFDDRSLDDYVDVAERLVKFRADHPEGRLRPADPAMPYHVVRVPNGWCVRCKGSQVVKKDRAWVKCPRCQGSGVRGEGEPQEDVFIVCAAAAHRDAGDTEPGVGMAWEPYPGRTPYTAGSELQNAETSAWGRAIVASLAADAKRGVATAEEVRNRAAEQEEGGGGRWMNRRPDIPPKELRDKRTPTKTTGAEHEQLRDGTVEATPEDRPAQRVKRGQDQPPDPWQDQPSGRFDETPPEERTGSIDGRQRSQIFAKFNLLHIGEAERQRAVLSDILRRPVDSRKSLSYRDAETVLKDLQARVEAQDAAEAAAEQDAAAEEATP